MLKTPIIIIACSLVISGCGTMAGAVFLGDFSVFNAKVTGQIAARPASGEAQTLAFDDCMSGEPEGFFGVELVSTNAPAVLRVTEDPIEGTRARITRSGKTATFTAAGCSVLQARIAKTGTKINGTTLLDGEVTVDCRDGDGASYAGIVSFSSCHVSPHAMEVVASLEGGGARTTAQVASAVPIPNHTEVPTLPEPIKSLSVRPHVRIIGAVTGGETVSSAAASSLENARGFLREIGWHVVEDATADIEVEMAYTGHVAFTETPTSLTIIAPSGEDAAITLRSGTEIIDTIPRGPHVVRCDIPARADRLAQCVARVQAWSSARLERLLASSQTLASFAKKRLSRVE
jgi:hypothetical protein